MGGVADQFSLRVLLAILVAPIASLSITPEILIAAPHTIVVQANQPNIAVILQQGEQSFQRGRFPMALQSYQQALAIAQGKQDRLHEALALTGIGMVQISLEQYDAALQALQQAQTITNADASYRLAEGEVLYHLARLYVNMEEYGKAAPLLDRSLEIRQATGDRDREGKTTAFQGVLAAKTGKLPQALQLLELGLKQSQSVSDKASTAQILFYLGSIYSLVGQTEQAK